MDALAGPPEQAQLERAKRVQAKAAAVRARAEAPPPVAWQVGFQDPAQFGVVPDQFLRYLLENRGDEPDGASIGFVRTSKATQGGGGGAYLHYGCTMRGHLPAVTAVLTQRWDQLPTRPDGWLRYALLRDGRLAVEHRSAADMDSAFVKGQWMAFTPTNLYLFPPWALLPFAEHPVRVEPAAAMTPFPYARGATANVTPLPVRVRVKTAAEATLLWRDYTAKHKAPATPVFWLASDRHRKQQFPLDVGKPVNEWSPVGAAGLLAQEVQSWAAFLRMSATIPPERSRYEELRATMPASCASHAEPDTRTLHDWDVRAYLSHLHRRKEEEAARA